MLEFFKLIQIHAFKLYSLHYLPNHLQKTNLVKCQGTLRIKTQSIRKVHRKIYQTKHLSDYHYAQAFIIYVFFLQTWVTKHI